MQDRILDTIVQYVQEGDLGQTNMHQRILDRKCLQEGIHTKKYLQEEIMDRIIHRDVGIQEPFSVSGGEGGGVVRKLL
jgi:hypothetical protein